MYPRAELVELQACKTALQRRILVRRWEVALDVCQGARPLRFVDQVYGQWRRISPFAKLAAVPISLWLKQKFFRPRKISGLILRWLPTLVGAFLKTSGR